MKYFQKIELFLVRTGYLTKGEAPKDALESGVAAIAQLANVIKDLKLHVLSPTSPFLTPFLTALLQPVLVI